jgi:hypothetical protein
LLVYPLLNQDGSALLSSLAYSRVKVRESI